MCEIETASQFRGLTLLAFLAGTLALIPTAGAQITFAGTQISVASSALASPTGVTVDGKGNVYFADRNNNRVVSLAPANGGFGAPVTILSGLAGPMGVAADWSGNVYVADTGNNRIVMLPQTAAGLGTAVVVGSGLNGPTAVAVDSLDNLYVADTGNNRVVEFANNGGSYGSPIVLTSGLNSPSGVAIDTTGTLYVSDSGNNRVLKEAPSAGGYMIQAIWGKGLSGPTGIFVDKNNNLYIADTGNGRIVEEPWSAGAKRYSTQTIAGSSFASPQGVVVDWNGNLYVADAQANDVIEVVTGGINFSATQAGETTAEQTYNFNIAAGTTLGNVSVYSQGVVGKDFIEVASSNCAEQTYQAASLCAVSVVFSPLASGKRIGSVTLYDNFGNSLATAYLSGVGLEPQAAFLPGTATQFGSELSGPSGVAVDGSGNLYIADTGNNRVVELPWTGSGYAAQTTVPVTGLISPMALTVDGAGNLYVVSNGNDKALKLPWMGSSFGVAAKVGNGLYGPSGVAVDGSGNVYIADTLNSQLDKLPWTGSAYLQSQSLGNYRKFPMSVAVDGSGNVYFAEPYLNQLVEIPLLNGQYQTQMNVPMSGVSFPSAVVADGNSNLYVLDTGNNRVVMLPWNGSSFGSQITVANGFNAPTGLAADSWGSIYVADTGNNQVVKIDLSTPGVVSYPLTYIGSTSAESVLVENLGNQPLFIASVTYPGDFPQGPAEADSCDANSVIGQGGSCELAIDFTPLATGSPLSEYATVTDNSLGVATSEQSISVVGTSLQEAAQTISFPEIATVIYGSGAVPLNASASSGLPIAYQVVSGPAVLTYGGNALVINGSGIVVVEATQAGNSSYGPASTITQSFTVAPATLTVTPMNLTAIYGAIPLAFKYTISGFALGQTVAQVVTGIPAIEASAGSTAGAGTYTITASQGTLSASNYTFLFVPGTLTVTKASLQVKAVSFLNTYGSALPTLPWTYAGFVNGDTAATIAGEPWMSTLADSGSPAGSYAIAISGGTLSTANYSFAFTPGIVRIVPAVLTVTVQNQSMTYGGTLPILSYAVSGFVQGDTTANAFQGQPAVSTRASSYSPVGFYPIRASPGSLTSNNYSFVFIPGSLQVQPAMLTVTPRSVSMNYGGALPALSFLLTGFVNGDSAHVVSGIASLSTVASSNSSVGVYAVAASNGTLSATNYVFSFASGYLTVNCAVVTVTAANQNMTYGAVVPALTYAMRGFVNGDTQGAAISGAPQLATVATPAAPVGQYAVAPGLGNLSATNYIFRFVAGIITICKAPLTVTANNLSVIAGTVVPPMTFSTSGLVSGDTLASAVGGTPALTTKATSSSAPGKFPIDVSRGSMTGINYKLIFVNGVITVTK